MSEQDFFFDEEPDDKKPAEQSRKATPGASSKATSSASKSAPAQRSQAVTPAPSEGMGDQSTTMAVAALIGVVGLLFGAILGFLLGNTIAKSGSTGTKSPVQSTTNGGSTGQAGPLTSGQTTLPPGHPPVNTPTTGTVDTTPNP